MNSGTDILSYFNTDRTPRQQQVDILSEVERLWKHTDVFVISAPVATGKSFLAECICNYAAAKGQTAMISTPTNQLFRQYLTDCRGFATPPSRRGRTAEDWDFVRNEYHYAERRLCNYYHILALKSYSNVMIFDEAHELLPMLQEQQGVIVWRHLNPWPDNVRTTQDVALWAARYTDKNLGKVSTLFEQYPVDELVVSKGWAEYRGREREFLQIAPLSPRKAKPYLWPPRTVKKLVFMSATISAEDIYDLGLDSRRVTYLTSSSPIPAERRPIFLDCSTQVNYGASEADLQQMAEYILDKLHEHPDKGVVHTTYALAAKLRPYLASESRLRWHTPQTASSTYQQWITSPTASGATLVACGMHTGIDLKDDLARWQIITKVQYPSLGEPAVAAQLRYRPSWYAWQAARILIQATGRVCRHPADYGATYIADKQFLRLYNQNPGMFPDWFKEAFA